MCSSASASPPVSDILRRFWGFDTLRPLQDHAIDLTLAGRDLLLVMPTGGGKSLCYQLPPLLDESGGITVVVSPLISLMKDQVDALGLIGYPAAALHSGLAEDESRRVIDDVKSGALRLLYTSPERLLTSGTLALLHRAAGGKGVARIAIDEAHCISQWGHDFRPEYRRLAELREVFPKAPIQAFTATATPAVREDIVRQLKLRTSETIVGIFDRPNLTYRIVPKVDPARQIAEAVHRHKGEATIAYCISRKDTEHVAKSLTAMGVPAEAYHAGLSPKVRRSVSENFARERLNVVIATVAFGMGIDRSNVRCVVHESMPRSIEGYQQETGRAGRDGLPAECLMLYSSADQLRWSRLIEMPPEDAPAPDPAHIARQLEHLEMVRRFATGIRCRHRTLSEHFGQKYESPDCGACDVCLKELHAVPDAHDTARKIISCVTRCNGFDSQFGYGAGHIADVLIGKATPKVRERRHDELSTFGLLASLRREQVVGFIDQLVDAGHLARAPGQYPTLTLTDTSAAVLKSTIQATLMQVEVKDGTSKRQREAMAAASGKRGKAEDPLTPKEAELFEALRFWRRELAERRSVPPYVILGDATLDELCRVRPSTRESLVNVRGIGAKKLDDFGAELLTELRRQCEARNLGLDAREGSRPRFVPAPVEDRSPTRGAMDAAPYFRRGSSIDDVAGALGRTPKTVVAYLADFIARERPASIAPWVDKATHKQVTDALAACGTGRLRPLYEHLGEMVPYEVIRLVVAFEGSRG